MISIYEILILIDAYPNSSPLLTSFPFSPPPVQLILPTRSAPIATNATGKPVAVWVKYKIERVLAVKTSKSGSFTACGFTIEIKEMCKCN